LPIVTVSVVIAALNEADSLPYVLSRIPGDVHEVILVDGASTDRTIEVARELMPTIRIVQQTGRGKGAALRDGFAAATGEIIVHLDADGSTDPAEIPMFVSTLVAGADYAKGTRFIQGASSTDITPVRRLGNWAFVMLANLLFGSQFSDITYGYNAIWRIHRDKLAPEIDGWAHEIVGNIRAIRHGLRVVEVACREKNRIAGEAKLKTFSAGWTILRAIVAERFRPLSEVPPVLQEPVTAGQTALEPAMAAVWPGVVAVPIRMDRDPVAIPVLAFDDYHGPEEIPSAASAGS
jgi:glycosyltransferase involved in cell wall biosynthesis